MKITLTFFLTFLNIISLSAEELSFNEKFKAGNNEIADFFKKSNKLFSISPLLSPRVSFGVITAKQNNKQYWIENNYQVSGFYSEGLKTIGFVYKYNYFFSGTRKGYFTQLIIGLDYVKFNGFGFSPGGSVPESKSDAFSGMIPNLSSGFGYSFQVGENSFLRMNLDIGIKWLGSNIYVAYVW